MAYTDICRHCIKKVCSYSNLSPNLKSHNLYFTDIDEEWQKTQCMPRETCVDVAKELGTNTAVFFKPPCVSVFRCGGCCNKEGVTCRNTSMTYINKTVSTTHCIAWVLQNNYVWAKCKQISNAICSIAHLDILGAICLIKKKFI